MFTGIIEHVGTVISAVHGGSDTVLIVDLGPLAVDAKLGDSIAVNGVCLTIEHLAGTHARFAVSAETRRKTTLGSWRDEARVNLERALRFGDRLGGHLVSGHVDGVGRVLERRAEGGGERLTIQLPESVMVVEKGSLTIDGISLTTWDCRAQRCTIAVVPHTLAHTTLSARRAGDPINLEQDLIARWVERMLRPGSA